jgi:hypothetical protein
MIWVSFSILKKLYSVTARVYRRFLSNGGVITARRRPSERGLRNKFNWKWLDEEIDLGGSIGKVKIGKKYWEDIEKRPCQVFVVQ